jgi:glycosyltransferase involved in cell wall biosynthesis
VAYNRKGHHVSGKEFESTKKIKEYNGIKIKTVFTFENGKLNAIVYSILAAIKASFSRFDVVHFHAEGPASMCWMPKLFGKRVVVTIHGLDWQRSKWGGFATKFLKFGERTAAKHADSIIVLSRNVQQYFLDTYGRETVYIPNGIEKPQVKDYSLIEEKFDLTKDNYILFLGRIVPEKGVHYLINAYKNIATDKKLVIAGGSSHTSDYVSQVKELAKGDERIIFTDFVQGEALEELYSNAYIYCLPSDLEGMPLSLLEAMSYGNCCLTSDIPECTEVCQNNAVYFEKGNEKDLQEKLQMLLDNKSVTDNYKQNACEYICNKFNWDDIVSQTIELYKG